MQTPIEKLSVHPLLASLPALAVDSPEMLALIVSVESHGALRPAIINDRLEVMDDDGRSLLYAATKAGLKEVPTIERPDEDAAAIVLDTLCARRHLTKSALAYLAFPLLDKAGESRQAIRIRGLKQGKKSPLLIQSTTGTSVEQIAASLGFERTYFYKAREVVHLFAAQADYKAKMEPELLSGEVSLQGVIAGWMGIQNTGQPRRRSDQLDLFGDVFGKLRYHFQRTWASLEPERRQALVPQVRDTVAEMPPEVREMFAKEIRDAIKAAREAGQSV